MASITKLLRRGKALILTYDDGLENGPRSFDKKSVDPEYVFDLALEGGFSAIATHIGVAEKYYHGPFRDVPLIVKLNGSTNLPHINPVSTQICSVERAIKAGASAVGFTIYDGSPNEPEMLAKFAQACEQAHEYGLPVIAWMYPRGPGIKTMDNEVLAYSARVGLELGADVLKMQFNGDDHNLQWMSRCSGRSRIVVSMGVHQSELDFLDNVKRIMSSGAAGIAVGGHLWKSKKPAAVAKALRAIVYDGKAVMTAQNYLK